MSDLVAQLRAVERSGCEGYRGAYVAKICGDAADKIDALVKALEEIVALDQMETFRTIEVDPAGNTMELIVVDGSFATIARAALAAARSRT